MTIIETSYVVSGNPELEDKELPAMLYSALGMTFYKFIEITLGKVRRAINGRCDEHLHVRCYKTKERGQGFCAKPLSLIVIGFCGDIEDLEITLIHELLHLFRWDEKMVEIKAGEIYKSSRGEA